MAITATSLQDLGARVTQIDGNGLADPTTSILSQHAREILGMRDTINQAVLAMEAQLQEIQQQLDSIQALLYTHLGQ